MATGINHELIFWTSHFYDSVNTPLYITMNKQIEVTYPRYIQMLAIGRRPRKNQHHPKVFVTTEAC